MPGTSGAVDLEQLVSPGPLSEKHLKLEGECGSCHSPFARESETGLCLECHEDVAADLHTKRGFHGRQPSARNCRGCHTEHLGRDGNIVGLDAETFDHAATDYAIRGAHRKAACASCHAPGERWRDAPASCQGCHGDDDPHRGAFGDDCAECHSERGWREARFDHDLTDFPLDGAHTDVTCALCHPAQRFEGTVKTCEGCHLVNDDHQGEFGGKCGRCHDTMAWTRGHFDHDALTRFPLRGRHRETACASCHGVAPDGRPRESAGSLDTRCISCHRADDEHGGRYGPECGDCHAPTTWQRLRFDHARDTGFELVGAHAPLPCRSCHRGDLHAVQLEGACSSCHAADDAHRGQEGSRCESCHDASSWTGRVAFDHDLTRLPLLGLHALVPCEECHRTLAFQDAPGDCVACHRTDDVHTTSLGEDCARCHNPNAWTHWQFDHDVQTRFALHGAHQGLDCKGCHYSPARAGVDRETRCESCHAADDPHHGSFGSACGFCHVDRGWDEVRITR